MLHLLFLIDPEPWGKKEMEDILKKVDSTLTFNFVGALRDKLVAKGLGDEFTRSRGFWKRGNMCFFQKWL